MKFCSFDIEIAQQIPEGEKDWKQHRPLGISCAATVNTGDERPTLWWDGMYSDGTHYGPKMTRDQCQELVRYLSTQRSRSYVPLTFNGLGFDFDVLAEESGMFEECRDLALNHVDLMFHFFCVKGFAIGQDAACRGMGLEGKPEGMHGALAPELWAAGEHQKVLDYVSSDATQLLRLAELVARRGWLTWNTKRGTPANMVIKELLTVNEAMELPEPDVSWMDAPWPRSKFYGWTVTEEDVTCDWAAIWKQAAKRNWRRAGAAVKAFENVNRHAAALRQRAEAAEARVAELESKVVGGNPYATKWEVVDDETD